MDTVEREVYYEVKRSRYVILFREGYGSFGCVWRYIPTIPEWTILIYREHVIKAAHPLSDLGRKHLLRHFHLERFAVHRSLEILQKTPPIQLMRTRRWMEQERRLPVKHSRSDDVLNPIPAIFVM